MMINNYSFFVTTAKGIEPLLLAELKQFDIKDAKETLLGISFNASLESAYKICLSSYLAHHVLLLLDQTEVDSASDLYQAIGKINWSDHIPLEGSFRIDVTGKHPKMNNTQFIAQKSKDAIVDQMRNRHNIRPNISLKEPDVVITLHINRNTLTTYISLSGDSLHRRGYHLESGSAPLKETLASAILIRSNWQKQMLSDDACLIDPMCGSGTLLIEAALMAYEIAPGIDRAYYGFLNWLKHDQSLWQKLLLEAKEKRIKNLKNLYTEIKGFDIDPKQIEIAKANTKRAKLESVITFKCQDISELNVKAFDHSLGLIVTNPPYGQRLMHGEDEKLDRLMAEFGKILQAQFIGWQLSIFSANDQSMKQIGIRSHKQYKLYNGQIEAKLFNFTIDPSRFMNNETPEEKMKRKAQSHYQNPSDTLPMFENRLKKNLKHLSRWAKRNAIEAYRLYDQDLPEYALAIDLYGDYLHIQEYQAGSSVDPLKATRRLYEAIAALQNLLEIPYDHIFVKMRQKQKGKNQYERKDTQQTFHIVKEDKAKFYVNLSDYLDTGLFLDHRLMRLYVAESAKGKKLLNLFAYTCTASTLAALYGAKSITSVDLSNTYLNWGKRNFKLNQIDINKHQFIQADCFKWLNESKEYYDVIFLDPPTFSNSKRMDDTLDIQRDHLKLIQLAMKRLAPNGCLFFSNNYRRFKLDEQIEKLYHCEQISHLCLSEDFKRHPNIHHCYKIQKNKM